MKKSWTTLSLFILVALFLWTQPWQTTYAYFTDSVSVDGDISLKLGTLSLAEIPSQNVTIKKGMTTAELLPVKIKNTGSLDGKLTIKGITAKMGDTQINNIEEYLKVVPTNLLLKVLAGEEKTLAVQLEKIKDWPENTPITLSINLRISQGNLSETDRGFIDEKSLEITVKNEKPTDWPEFTGDIYIKQNTYYSVVKEKKEYTNVIPGELYLKEERILTPTQIDKFITGVIVTNNQNGKYTSDIKYIQGKGFHFRNVRMLSYVSNNTSNNHNNSFNVNIIYPKDIDNSKFITIDAFAQPFILSSDIVEQDNIKVPTTIILNEKDKNVNLTFHTHNNQKPLTKDLSYNERAYVEKNLTVSLSESNHFNVEYIANHSGLIVKRTDNGNNKNSTIMLKRGSEIVFSREVKGSKHSGMRSTETSELAKLSTETQGEIIESSAVTDGNTNVTEIGLEDDKSNSLTLETTENQEESTSTTVESTINTEDTESSSTTTSEMIEETREQLVSTTESVEQQETTLESWTKQIEPVATIFPPVIAREEEINQTQEPCMEEE